MKNAVFVCAERLNCTSASIQLRKAASEKKGGTLQPELRRGGVHKRPAVGFLHLLRKCFKILLLDAPRCRLSFGFIAQTQTFEGSFSAVSQPMFSSKYSFCSILRYLQELHTPAALQTLHKFRRKTTEVGQKCIFVRYSLFANYISRIVRYSLQTMQVASRCCKFRGIIIAKFIDQNVGNTMQHNATQF